jgi:hypothetical protein
MTKTVVLKWCSNRSKYCIKHCQLGASQFCWYVTCVPSVTRVSHVLLPEYRTFSECWWWKWKKERKQPINMKIHKYETSRTSEFLTQKWEDYMQLQQHLLRIITKIQREKYNFSNKSQIHITLLQHTTYYTMKSHSTQLTLVPQDMQCSVRLWYLSSCELWHVQTQLSPP